MSVATTNADRTLSRVRRQELNNLLPEEFRRFDVRDRSYIRAQPSYVSEHMLRTPPPKRITVQEELVEQKADPVTGYAELGYVGQVCSASHTQHSCILVRAWLALPCDLMIPMSLKHRVAFRTRGRARRCRTASWGGRSTWRRCARSRRSCACTRRARSSPARRTTQRWGTLSSSL